MLLLNATLLADAGIGVEKTFALAVRETFSPDVPPLHNHSAIDPQFALPSYHPFADFGVDRDSRCRFRYVGLTHAPGDVSSIKQHVISTQAWLNLDPRFVCEFGESGFIIERDVPFNRLQRQGPVHGAAFEVCIAPLARQPGCDSALSNASRAVNSDHQFSRGIGHDRVRLYTESWRI